MPKRIGFLYEKMADKGFIRRVILEPRAGSASAGRCAGCSKTWMNMWTRPMR